jgi:hypothetical protein
MKQSELYKYLRNLRYWLLTQAQQQLSQENLGRVEYLIKRVKELEDWMEMIRPYCIDYNKEEKPSPTE